MIALIDYGAGNLRSVWKALKKLGARVQLVRSADELAETSAVVLPGVGAFDDCATALANQGLMAPLRSRVESGQPFLGICVGYQILFEASEEFNSQARGMSVCPGKVVRFRDRPGLKIPQIGWNQLEIARPDCPLYRGLPSGCHVYFVHSYFPATTDASLVATWTEHGERFASSIWRQNLFATQYHPEKSQEVGLAVLRNFLDFSGQN